MTITATYFVFHSHFFTIAGVNNPIAIAQISYAVQLLGNIGSWFAIESLGRRTLAVYGMALMSSLLLVIGVVSTIQGNKLALDATVALMTVWGFILSTRDSSQVKINFR
jgi:hypothetical protein